MKDLQDIPNNFNTYYLNIFNVSQEATVDDILKLFEGKNVTNVLPAGHNNTLYNIEFKNKIDLFKVCRMKPEDLTLCG